MGNGRTYDVCVVGSGITALVTAGIFAQKNFSVCVVAPPSREESESGDIPPRYYSISASSRRIFEFLEVWERFNRTNGGLVRGIQVWGQEARPLIEFLPTIERLSPLAWILERQNILSALLVAIRGLGVDIIESELIKVDCAEDIGLVHLERCEFRASIIVGADGRNSKVRQSMGVSLVTKKIEQEAVVAVVQTEKSHHNFACQRFLQTGPIAFLPLSDPYLSSIVWSCQPLEAQRLTEGGQFFNEAVTSVFGHKYGEVVDSRAHMSFGIESGVASSFFSGRGVLVGESAHVMHPLAGQGLNTALLDVASLAECIDNKDVLGSYSSLRRRLRRYERWRKAEVLKMLSVTDGLNSLFSSKNIFTSLFTTLGARSINYSPFVKDFLISHAAGVYGDVPEMVRHK